MLGLGALYQLTSLAMEVLADRWLSVEIEKRFLLKITVILFLKAFFFIEQGIHVLKKDHRVTKSFDCQIIKSN